MLTWPCDYPGCTSRTMLKQGECMSCGKHLCGDHFSDSEHLCLGYDSDEGDTAEWEIDQADSRELLQAVRDANLDKIASSMRPNHTCTIDIPEDPRSILEGGMNSHFILTFDDGVKWIVRVRKITFRSPLKGIRRMTDESEMETMKILHQVTDLVPMIHEVPSHLRDRTGSLDYFFMDYVEGRPLNAPIENDEEATPEQLKTMIHDYALFQIKLKSMTFDAVGSIYPSTSTSNTNITPDGSSITVGPLLSLYLPFDEPPHFLGPFKNTKERYLAIIDRMLFLIKDKSLYPDETLFSYLGFLEMRDLVGKYDKWDDDGRYYIKHADDKGDHILIDEEGHITGVIDWEWAYVTSKAEAFGSCHGLAPALFEEGINSLSDLECQLIREYESLGHPDLAKCIRESRFYLRLGLVVDSWPDTECMNRLRAIVEKDPVSFEHQAEYQEWLVGNYGEDEFVNILLEDDSDGDC